MSKSYDCLNDAGFLKLIEEVQSKYSIDKLHEKVTAITQTAEMRLNFDSIPVMRQNLHRMSQVQVQLRNVYGKLDSVTKKINKQAVYILNIDVLKALFGLLGQSITGLGLDENGVIVFYNHVQFLSSLGVWLGYKRFSEEQVRWDAQTLMSTVGDVTQAQDINEIKLMLHKIKQAIASVEKIPNSFFFSLPNSTKRYCEISRATQRS